MGALALLVLACVLLGAVVSAIEAVGSAISQVLSDNPWLVPVALLVASAAAVGAGLLWWKRHQAQQIKAEQARQAWLAEQARQQWLAHLRTLQGLLTLSPTDFERAVGQMLMASGYRNIQHKGGAGDLSADLTCVAPDGRSVVVQCKRYAPDNPVGSPEIQKFLGMVTVHHHAHLGLFVTTSTFTKPAVALAQQHGQYLQLIDGDRVAEMMRVVR